MVNRTTARSVGRAGNGGRVKRTAWAWARVAAGLAILLAIAWHVGAGPFLQGVRDVRLPAVLLAGLITAVVTACSALRWQLVARGLGMTLSLHVAIGAYYRSQFLNTALPGGVLGDVHRGFDHGRATGDLGRGLRAVGWERVAGQVVQLAVAAVVLAVVPSPVRPVLPVLLAGCLVLALVLVVLHVQSRRVGTSSGTSRRARAWRTARVDLRDAVLARSAWPAVTLLSLAVLAGHVAVFVIAARTVGIGAGLRVLVPLALLVLVAAALPANVGGWGPREGVAAWAFAGAGLGADQGIAAATAFGVLVFVASLPGAVVLVARAMRRSPLPAEPDDRVLVGAGRG